MLLKYQITSFGISIWLATCRKMTGPIGVTTSGAIWRGMCVRASNVYIHRLASVNCPRVKHTQARPQNSNVENETLLIKSRKTTNNAVQLAGTLFQQTLKHVLSSPNITFNRHSPFNCAEAADRKSICVMPTKTLRGLQKKYTYLFVPL